MAKANNPKKAASGKLGGLARMASLTHKERFKLASKAGTARAKKLTAQERQQIAKKAVQARETKRAEKRKRS